MTHSGKDFSTKIVAIPFTGEPCATCGKRAHWMFGRPMAVYHPEPKFYCSGKCVCQRRK